MSRDQSVTTCRLAPDSHLVLIVDVDPGGLDLAGRRLLAAVRKAVGAWEADEKPEATPAREAPPTTPATPQAVLRALPQRRGPFLSEETNR